MHYLKLFSWPHINGIKQWCPQWQWGWWTFKLDSKIFETTFRSSKTNKYKDKTFRIWCVRIWIRLQLVLVLASATLIWSNKGYFFAFKMEFCFSILFPCTKENYFFGYPRGIFKDHPCFMKNHFNRIQNLTSSLG